uniref:Mandelate racemase/muconate lactonizing enzyme family protein n=2 Tax=Litorilinea aerophila TaxID=1204385 RepID=A0A540VG11_9CHLR
MGFTAVEPPYVTDTRWIVYAIPASLAIWRAKCAGHLSLVAVWVTLGLLVLGFLHLPGFPSYPPQVHRIQGVYNAMKIARVDAFAIKLPPADTGNEGTTENLDTYGDYFIARDAWTSIYSRAHETCLVRVEADNGLVGWGEGQAPVGGRAVRAIVEDLCRPVLLGQDPFDVEYLWYRLYSAMRERGHVTGFYVDALAGVDLALYDLMGKALGKPAHKLLGGQFRDRVRVYAGIGGTDEATLVRQAQEHVAEGYQALKLHLRVSTPEILQIVQAVREVVGPQVELMVDIHMLRDVSGAIELGRGLEQLGVRWLESPTQPEDVHGQAEVARALDMQVATGEWLRTTWEWRQWIEHRAFDVAMPDIARTGLSEGKRIAALCDSFNLPIAPHVGGGGILAVAASVAYSAAIPNFQILEHAHRAHAQKARIARRFPEPVDGAFPVEDVPGLGVEIDEDAVARFTV